MPDSTGDSKDIALTLMTFAKNFDKWRTENGVYAATGDREAVVDGQATADTLKGPSPVDTNGEYGNLSPMAQTGRRNVRRTTTSHLWHCDFCAAPFPEKWILRTNPTRCPECKGAWSRANRQGDGQQ
jgi:hypothetical protein